MFVRKSKFHELKMFACAFPGNALILLTIQSLRTHLNRLHLSRCSVMYTFLVSTTVCRRMNPGFIGNSLARKLLVRICLEKSVLKSVTIASSNLFW